MQATFPIKIFPWHYYAVPVIICIAITVMGLVMYPGLADVLKTNTSGATQSKEAYMISMLSMVWGLFVVLLLLDRLLVYRNIPVPVISAVCGGVLLMFLVIHLGIMGVFNLDSMAGWQAGVIIIGAMIGYIVVHFTFARFYTDPKPAGTKLWDDYPPQSLLTTILFFIRPILPSRVEIYEDGVVIISLVYTIAIPWNQIKSVALATPSEAVGGMAVRIASSPVSAIKMSVDGVRWPVVMSLNDRERFMEEWEKRTSP